MSDVGRLTFLPWLRHGMATQIDAASAAVSPRVNVAVRVTFNEGTIPAPATLALKGPGEILGIDPRAVIRTSPAAGVPDAEANLFPLVEFAEVDLPWRYSPAEPDALGRLRPWIVLVVLAETEIAAYSTPRPGRALAAVDVRPDLLPKLDQAWAWAHVQLSGASGSTAADVAALLRDAPHRAISRILSPRRLLPRTAYRALLVPAYERGRLAGLGLPVLDSVTAAQPAWDSTPTGPVQLPIYFETRFGTAEAGDFEYWVSQLTPRPMPDDVGLRRIDVNHAGSGIPAVATSTIDLEGALRGPETSARPWPAAQRAPVVARIAQLVNAPADLLGGPAADPPALAPPLYGRWHAQQNRVGANGTPPWFHELNEDPRTRTAAGAGTEVVQDQQRQLMASAWQQVDGIRAANERLRFAQLGREVAERLFVRHVETDDPEAVLRLTRRLHARLLATSITIDAALERSPVVPGMLDTTWRRTARARGPVGRRQLRGARPARSTLLARANAAAIVAPPPAAPSAMATLARSGRRLVRSNLTARLAALIRSAQPSEVRGAAQRPRFAAVEVMPGGDVVRSALSPRGTAIDSESARAFRAASNALTSRLGTEVAAGPELHQVHLDTLRTTLLTRLNPRQTIAARVRATLHLPDDMISTPIDPLEPIMAAPEFPQPMYAPLAARSQDWILPGLDRILPNTATMALTNQRFIEAYMVGVNHEMARELLWHEFPTDQRGTYFRQFWDVAGRIAVAATPLEDIKAIHEWPKTAALGANSARERPPDADEDLVLVIRGEVMRRYPRTIVYAVRAALDEFDRPALGEERLDPVFHGTLTPDVMFFGFEMTAAAARGNATDLGWYFVLQEQPSEPQFGLDVGGTPAAAPNEWNDLAWEHLAADATALAALTYVDLTAAHPDTSAISDREGVNWHADGHGGPHAPTAADLAYITVQQPVRVAMHATALLPPESPDA